MVPGAIVFVRRLPLTPNDKVDRKALPPLTAETRAALREKGDDWAAPEGEYERAVARAYESLLGVDDVGREDSFAHLGGHSLLAAKLLRKLGEEVLRGESLTLAEFAETDGVVSRVAEALESKAEEIDAVASLAPRGQTASLHRSRFFSSDRQPSPSLDTLDSGRVESPPADEAVVVRELTDFPHAVRETPAVWIGVGGGASRNAPARAPARLAARLWTPADKAGAAAAAAPARSAVRDRGAAVPPVGRHARARRDDVPVARGPRVRVRARRRARLRRLARGGARGARGLEARDGRGVLGRADRRPRRRRAVGGRAAVVRRRRLRDGLQLGRHRRARARRAFGAGSRAPLAPLRGVIAVCATDDIYEDDMHFVGGVPLLDQLPWAARFAAMATLPPAIVPAGRAADAAAGDG